MAPRNYVSVVTIGAYSIYAVNADPNGSLDAAVGSLAMIASTGQLWQNVDGANTWNLLRGGVILWRPSEPNPTGNVYATWQTVYAAAIASPVAVVIQVDTSLATANIPAGTWDFSDLEVELAGPYESGIEVVLEDGALLVGVSKFSRMILTSQSSAAAITVEAGQIGMTFDRVTLQRSGAGTPVIEIANGSAARMTFIDCILDNYVVTADGTTILVLEGSTTMTSLSVAGTTGALQVICGSDAQPRFDQSGFSGTFATRLFQNKSKNFYVNRSNVGSTNLLTLASNNVNFTQAGTGTLNLPAATSATGPWFLKNNGGGAITIAPNGADTIDQVAGSINLAIGAAVTLISNGTNGWISG